MQSRLSSLYEALINIAIGFSINFTANLWLIPQFATDGQGGPAHLSLLANWWLGCAFTVISLTRQYVIRRWFNGSAARAAARLAQLSSKQ